MTKIFIATLVFIASSKVATSQIINTAPLDAYWKMVEPLKQGDSLSVDTWNQFLQIEANNIYIKNQGFDSSYLSRLRKAIQTVYMPKYDSLLKVSVLDTNRYWLIYKVNNYKLFEKELKEYEKKVVEQGYLKSLYKRCWEWLPKSLQTRDTATTIYLLGIENDAIAGGHTMILTLWAAYNQDKLKPGTLTGHEMHHILRRPLQFKGVEDQDKGIMYVLKVILNEGSADMIDKRVNLAHKDKLPYGLYYGDILLDKADSIIDQIDSSLISMADSNGKIFKTEGEYRKLIKWSSGHCPGYVMANTIVKNGFKKELIRNIQNPFAFVYLYNKAAKQDTSHPPVFSPVAIKMVQQLEQKYWSLREELAD